MANAESVNLTNCLACVSQFFYTESGKGRDGDTVKKGFSVSATSQFVCTLFVKDIAKPEPRYPLPDGQATYTDGGDEMKPKCERTDCTNNTGM